WLFQSRWEPELLASSVRRSSQHLLELSDSRACDQHFLVVDQRQRISIARLDYGHVSQITRCQIDVFVQRISNDQHRVQTHVLELLRGQTSLGGLQREGFDYGDTVFTGQLGKNRAQTGTIHFLVDLVSEVFVRRIREG